MRIGKHELQREGRTFVVAEIGINHNGNIDIAKKLIDVAKLAGCDAVKFQKRTVDAVYTPEELDLPRESPFGSTNGDLKRGLEFGTIEYDIIADYCALNGMLWFASPWDPDSVDFLESFDVPAYKVASACITDSVLLQGIAQARKPIIMSTGMSTLEEIDRAVVRLEACDQALLACTSSYPARLEDLNLNRISTLMFRYSDCPIGWSGHEISPWPTLCAVGMGAVIVERHITLDRSMWGSDQAASLEPAALIKLVKEIRDLEIARGSGELRLLACEIQIREKLRKVKNAASN